MPLAPDQLELLDADHDLAELARGADVTFAIGAAGERLTPIRFSGGSVTEGYSEDVEFEVALQPDDWRAILSDAPSARRQHPLAFIAPRGSGTVVGSMQSFAQHLHLLRRSFEVLRGSVAEAPDAHRPRTAGLGHVRGQYLPVEIAGWGSCDVYVERAGSGRPLLLLHTAGADGRQYHGLMRDERLLAEYELISFDLPWHGKSDPPAEGTATGYRLDSGLYANAIAAVIAALRLDRPPVLVGASMAGAAVIEFVARHPESVGGVVSCQAGPRVTRRHTPWLRNPRINQTLHVPEWTFGLMSPHSPKRERDRVWWGYSQGGYGVYEADITYYSEDWDIDRVIDGITDSTPPLVLLSGVYDYTVPPSDTESLAARLPQASFRTMPELGHFPHAENPPAFAAHLESALEWIAARAAGQAQDDE